MCNSSFVKTSVGRCRSSPAEAGCWPPASAPQSRLSHTVTCYGFTVGVYVCGGAENTSSFQKPPSPHIGQLTVCPELLRDFSTSLVPHLLFSHVSGFPSRVRVVIVYGEWKEFLFVCLFLSAVSLCRHGLNLFIFVFNLNSVL